MTNPQVMLPPICDRHDHDLIVRQLKLRPSDPWRVYHVVAQLLLFNRVVAEDGIAKRAEGDASNLTLVLAELGCLACARPALYRRVVLVCRKGLEHAAAVSRGERTDPDLDGPEGK